MPETLAAARLWLQKWGWYERNSLPWNRARIHYELARRQAFARWPLHGDVLETLLDGRLEVGPHVLFEPGVWITAPAPARGRIGGGPVLHRFDDPTEPVPWQGFTTKGPTRVGDNVWCGANVVITSGVSIGERCVIGANSVVTEDIPAFSVAAGAPAKVLRKISYE
jgi:acetyltransferase-like isoleucine patch superfamily enzyme